ncbi:hypothetical protein [Flavobacterium davisii]|uniref:hypothetical protein n=1 Tax=Flavobacterium davisii TaxID=2906077 RepID=UPI0035CEBEAD
MFKEQIKFDAKITGKYKNEFKVFNLQNKIEGNLEVDMKGAIGLKIKYGYENEQGLFLNQKLYFSGLKGTYKGQFKAQNSKYGKYEYQTNNGNPTPFTLLEPFELDLITIQMFNHNKKE